MTTDLATHINGRLKGRATPELPAFTFKDSGVTVRLHKLSPMTAQEVVSQARREMASEEPQPPMVEVDYGNGKVTEPHRGHPVYVERHADWEARVQSLANERLFRLACLDAIEVEIGETEKHAIERKKRYLRIAARIDHEDDPLLTPEENEQLFFITHIACATPDDLREFYQAIIMRSQPTEAAIEAHKASFPGDVQGPERVEL